MDTSTAPELGPNDQIQFAAFHRVSLEAGDYQVEVAQVIEVTDLKDVKSNATFKRAPQAFSVLCERKQLSPEQIHAVFPPPGSQGIYWRDFPHVILERSTLPWERTAQKDDADAATAPPWLAVLLFHEADPIPVPMPRKNWKELCAGSSSPHFPGLHAESGDHDDDTFVVIDVPGALLQAQLGKPFSFDLQTHTRRRLSYLGRTTTELPVPPAPPALPATLDQPASPASKLKLPPVDRKIIDTFAASLEIALSPSTTMECYEPGEKWRLRDATARKEYEIWFGQGGYDFYLVSDETATVIGNRLPQPKARNVAHLVSLEGRWSGTEFDWANDPTGTYRLVSLFRWEFFCEEPQRDFVGLLEHLNIPKGADPKIANPQKDPLRFHLPVNQKDGDDLAWKYLGAGFVPLTHRFRQGARSVSWYHGPLVPREIGNTVADEPDKADAVGVSLPASAADKLVIFDENSGLFDVSYAAAWELGRMMMLSNTRVALELSRWKHASVSSINSDRHVADYGYDLPRKGAPFKDAPFPEDVNTFLGEITRLEHVPFNYLVPDPALLPPESLRFFSVDRAWIECLRDGAFSIGRVTTSDPAKPSSPAIPYLSGVLLRSEVVAGFGSGLLIRGYTQPVAPAEIRTPDLSADSLHYPSAALLRMEKLSDHVMLFLFSSPDGPVQMVDFYLKPERLHFGLEEKESTPADLDTTKAGWAGNLRKRRRTEEGIETQAPIEFQDLAPGAKPSDVQQDAAPQVIQIAADRVVDFNQLRAQLEKLSTPAQLNGAPKLPPEAFALTMVSGVSLVRFYLPSS